MTFRTDDPLGMGDPLTRFRTFAEFFDGIRPLVGREFVHDGVHEILLPARFAVEYEG